MMEGFPQPISDHLPVDWKEETLITTSKRTQKFIIA